MAAAVRHGRVRDGTMVPRDVASAWTRRRESGGSRRSSLLLLFWQAHDAIPERRTMLPRLTALLALALGLLRIAALSLHPDKLIADAPFSLADEVE